MKPFLLNIDADVSQGEKRRKKERITICITFQLNKKFIMGSKYWIIAKKCNVQDLYKSPNKSHWKGTPYPHNKIQKII